MRKYVEIFKDSADGYCEKCIPYEQSSEYISKGWRISRLTKISDKAIREKWYHAIAAYENLN